MPLLLILLFSGRFQLPELSLLCQILEILGVSYSIRHFYETEAINIYLLITVFITKILLTKVDIYYNFMRTNILCVLVMLVYTLMAMPHLLILYIPCDIIGGIHFN
jgi:hypothetical protein